MYPYKDLEACLRSDIANAGITLTDTPAPYMGCDIRQVRAQQLCRSFYKKLNPLGDRTEADAKALEKFLALNASIPTTFEYVAGSEQESLYWDYFRDNLLKTLTPGEAFDLGYYRETFAVGPGASLGAESESFYTKLFCSKLTGTHPHLLALYRAAILQSPTWAKAEMQRHKEFGEKIVSGNRLFFVEKTTEISRTCCTEPTLNMLLEKAICAWLESCLLRSFGISLKTQPDFNRSLARIGSIDGSFGTIDLVSASDSISWAMCKRVIPSSILGWLRIARCEFTTLPNGEELPLNMISTMGNAFTFPLQTIIFACAVRAVYQVLGLPSACPRTQFGVFGDDIVVKNEAYLPVCGLLSKLGFEVNVNKSFNTGSFRESCGHDWHDGHFVRGVYIKSLETVSAVYSAINRLVRWSAKAGIPLLSTVNHLRQQALLLRKKELRVPPSEAVDSGIQVPLKVFKEPCDANGWWHYRKMVAKQRKRAVPEDQEGSDALRYRSFNSNGIAITFLGGFARRPDVPDKIFAHDWSRTTFRESPVAFMTLRQRDRNIRYKVIRGTIPYWDWTGSNRGLTVDTGEEDSSPYDSNDTAMVSWLAWESSAAGHL